MENQGLISFKPASRGRIGRILASTFFVFVVPFLVIGCKQKIDPQLFTMPENVTLQTGDIVFRAGESSESRVVSVVDTSCIYTHTGIVLYNGGRWQVLHAVPNERARKEDKDSVKIEPIGLFFRSDRAKHGAVLRLSLTPDDTLLLKRNGLALLQRHPLFDAAFDDKDSLTFYCTELVWFLYQQTLNIDLTDGRRHHVPLFPPIILCSDILEYPSLQEIYSF